MSMPEGGAGFNNPPGRWVGRPEVYDAAGTFLGHASDQRRVQDLGGGRVSIDIAIDGPFSIHGHYFIHDHGTYRNYLGPANVGGADILAPNLIDSTSYWAPVGLNQRFLLLILPDEDVQLSLTLLSRGEHLKYVVIGESVLVRSDTDARRVLDGAPGPVTHGAMYSLGRWEGQVTMIDHEQGQTLYAQQIDEVSVDRDGHLRLRTMRSNSPATAEVVFGYEGQAIWTLPDQPITGSASIWGGRALSGTFVSSLFDDQPPVRSWRREVIRRDGRSKIVVTTFTRQGARVATTFGLLRRVE